MNNEVSYQISPEVLNIFTSNDIDKVLAKYHLDNYYYSKQIHSTIVNIVDKNYQNNTEGDALITSTPNTPLIIKTADCIPFLIYDKENNVIGVVHSGWLGTLNNIVGNTINAMINKFNSKKENLYVYLYPSIRACHFEVESDVYLQFKNKIKNIDMYITNKGTKYHIDLQQIVKDNLIALGITNIEDSNICTYCYHNLFHSYRYNKTDKRNILLAMIKE